MNTPNTDPAAARTPLRAPSPAGASPVTDPICGVGGGTALLPERAGPTRYTAECETCGVGESEFRDVIDGECDGCWRERQRQPEHGPAQEGK